MSGLRRGAMLVSNWVSIGAVLLGAMGCGRPQPPPAPPPAAVTVAHPVEREVIEWDEYAGRLESVETVDVRARVSGFIEKAPFEEGALVNKGDLLFVLDARPYKAELEKAQAELQRAEAQRDYAAADLARFEKLRPSDAASVQELENARLAVRQAEAAVAAARAVVESAALNVQWCQVTAPIAGRVSRKNVTPGNLVNGGAGDTTLLTNIASIEPIYCYVDVDERSVLKYQQLSKDKKRLSARETAIPVFMQLSNETGAPHEGVIDFVDNRIDPNTGTMRARGVFPNPNGWLTPGLFARMRVPGSGRYRATLVPDAAVGTDQNQRFLLLVKEDDTVERRVITLGHLFDGMRAIEEGVTTQDRIVINGLQRAMPGTKVKPEEVVLPNEPVVPGSAATQALPATRNLLNPGAATAPSAPATRSAPTPVPTTGGAQ